MKVCLDKNQESALRWILKIFQKEKVKYEIIWWLAAKFYGSKRRLNDIDININQDDYDRIYPHITKYISLPLEYYKDENGKLEEVTLNYKWQEVEIWLNETTFIKDKKDWLRLAYDDHKIKYTLLKYKNIFVHVQLKENLIKDKAICCRPQDIQDLKQITSTI